MVGRYMDTIRILLAKLLKVCVIIGFVFYLLMGLAGFFKGIEGAVYHILYAVLILLIGGIIEYKLDPRNSLYYKGK